MNVHKTTAVLITGLLVPRLYLRLATKIPRELPFSHFAEPLAARITHTAMYAFMCVMPATGISMAYYSGKGISFFGYSIPGKVSRPPQRQHPTHPTVHALRSHM